MFIRRHLWAICFSLCLIGFTAYLLLDTFAIRRVYTVVPQTGNSVSSAEESGSAESDDTDVVAGAADTDSAGDTETDDSDIESAMSAEMDADGTGTDTTANSYSDGNISITLTEYRKYDTTIYVADVQITSVSDLKTAFADSSYGRNITEKTSDIAEDVNAILAVNGDFYGAQESGYVIRNGVLYRDTAEDRQDLVIYEDGSFEVIEESEVTAQELLDKGAWQVL